VIPGKNCQQIHGVMPLLNLVRIANPFDLIDQEQYNFAGVFFVD
jgi:hypothetical protein